MLLAITSSGKVTGGNQGALNERSSTGKHGTFYWDIVDSGITWKMIGPSESIKRGRPPLDKYGSLINKI